MRGLFEDVFGIYRAEICGVLEPTEGELPIAANAEAVVKAEEHEAGCLGGALHGSVANLVHRFGGGCGGAEPVGVEVAEQELSAVVIAV